MKTTLMATSFFIAASLGLVNASTSQGASLAVVDADGKELASFKAEALEAMGTRSIETSTPWTDGKIVFTGVDAERFMAQVGHAGRDITAIALDDYAAELDWADIVENNALIATRMNGEPLTLDNKGPFWIVYDFDEAPEAVFSELISKAVWHLHEIEITEH